MVWIGNPSNPTGVLVDREKIRALAKAHRDVIFVIDEAFTEFLPDCTDRTLLGAPEPNIIVLRSLTKFFALAGLRLGFLVAVPDMVRRLASMKEPWTVNGLAQAVGEHLYDDADYITRTRAVVSQEREFLAKELAALPGLHPFPSQANFILTRLDTPGITSGGVKHQLLHHRILIRDASNFHGLDSRFFRVAVKSREDNVRLIEALRQVLTAIPAKETP
jgi:threonine-phosphate decarboxylase